jgi:pilus assembly protein Flp/PilA
MKKGQGLVEYALILVLVAIVVIAVLTILKPAVAGLTSEMNQNDLQIPENPQSSVNINIRFICTEYTYINWSCPEDAQVRMYRGDDGLGNWVPVLIPFANRWYQTDTNSDIFQLSHFTLYPLSQSDFESDKLDVIVNVYLRHEVRSDHIQFESDSVVIKYYTKSDYVRINIKTDHGIAIDQFIDFMLLFGYDPEKSLGDRTIPTQSWVFIELKK